MDISTLNRLKEWFFGYCETFHSADPVHNQNIQLKEVHTAKVCSDMARIAADEGFEGDDLATAEAVALLHDVGRFEQYRRFHTFRDSESVNHAMLGVRVLTETGVLGCLHPSERRIIQQAVCFHNAFTIPDATIIQAALPYLLLVRDADKLDIWRVFIELFDLPPQQRASAAVLGLPETEDFSAELLAPLYEGRMINLAQLHCANDFKLLQLSWVYDLNFKASMRVVHERDYISRLARTLPADSRIEDVVRVLNDYVVQQIAEPVR